jgi:hypothetical protein
MTKIAIVNATTFAPKNFDSTAPTDAPTAGSNYAFNGERERRAQSGLHHDQSFFAMSLAPKILNLFEYQPSKS